MDNDLNAGSNPISVRLQAGDLDDPIVQELLRATFKAVKPGATPWSQRSEAEGRPYEESMAQEV